MKEIIELNGKKYKQIEEEEELYIGQSYSIFVFFASILMMSITAYLLKWEVVISFLLLALISSGVGINALDDINAKINKLKKKNK